MGSDQKELIEEAAEKLAVLTLENCFPGQFI